MSTGARKSKTGSKTGNISILRPDKAVKKKWKSYKFQATTFYLLYFKSDDLHKPDGQILLSSITKLETDRTKESSYPLQVHFSGRPDKGATSPWVLDLSSNDERIEWMETLKPGSSANLQKFVKSASLHLSPPIIPQGTNTMHNPYSLADPDPHDASNGTYPARPVDVSQSWHGQSLTAVRKSSAEYHSPQNYMEPLPGNSLGRKESDMGPDNFESALERESNDRYVQGGIGVLGSRSECIEGSNRIITSSTFGGHHNPSSQCKAPGRSDHSKSMIIHSPREHSTSSLSRTNTERKPPKSPDHMYEMDMDSYKISLSSPNKTPPQPRPRNVKQLPPCSNSKDPPVPPTDTESKYALLKEQDEYVYSDQMEPHGGNKPPSQLDIAASKEPEYDVPILPARPVPVPRQRTKPVGDSVSKVPTSLIQRPDHEQSISGLKPHVLPRRNPKSSDELSVKQSDYLDLLGSSQSEAGTHQMTNSQRSTNGSSFEATLSTSALSGISQHVFQNFNEDQVDTLIKMLQQVHSDSIQLPITRGRQAVNHSNSTDSSDTPTSNSHRTQQRKSFERVISYTPSLEAEKILVTDDDDGEGYVARPDWAKAVGLQKSTAAENRLDPDPLSDLEEEALRIPRNKLSDFVVIGEGQFGKVFRASMQRGANPISVAVKTAKKSTSSKEQNEFRQEMNIMSQMVHPNIVQLYGIIAEDVPAPWIVLEYLDNGDIKNFLTKNHRPIEKLVKYMIDVSMGMHYLSERGLIHRDLAARNVLVGDNETCKVSDFGLLRELPKDDSIYHMQTNVPCPVRWMPPESIADRKFSPASDVWSFGVLQWEMFHPDKTPYGNLGNLELAMKIMKGHRLDIPDKCPPLVSRIMKACWHHDPDRRPSFLLISTLLTTKVIYPEH